MKNKIPFILCMVLSQVLFWAYLLSQVNYKNHIIGYIALSLFSIVLTCTFVFYFATVAKIISGARTSFQVKVLEQEKLIKDKEEHRLKELAKEKESYKTRTLCQLNKLKDMLENNDPKEIQDYIQQMDSQLHAKKPYYYCNQALLNAIFHEKQNIAEEKGIAVEYGISTPARISIPLSDLASIFFNLLDNAIEACESSESVAPFVRLKTSYKGSSLSIHMINSKNVNLKFTKKTTKKDTVSHGLGLSIIEDILKAHNGHAAWNDLGDTFESILMLDISA